MITKSKLKTLKKVAIGVSWKEGNKTKSTWFTVYDTNKDEVLKILKEALDKSH